jgi:hypothetical protein
MITSRTKLNRTKPSRATMARIANTSVVLRHDHDAPSAVRVPLAPSRITGEDQGFAILDAKDLDALRRHGWQRSWFYNCGQVRTVDEHSVNKSVARILLDAPPGTKVLYRNRDRKDLRRLNLSLVGDRRPRGRSTRTPRPDRPFPLNPLDKGGRYAVGP